MRKTTRGTRINSTVIVLFAALFLTLSQAHTQERDLVSRAMDAGAFQTLLEATMAAGLEETLVHGGPFTVFAPTDAAFARLGAGVLETLLDDSETLKEVLSYHIVPGRRLATEVAKAPFMETLNGAAIEIRVREGALYVGGAEVVHGNIHAGNGVIHAIDRVIVPTGGDLNQRAGRVSGSDHPSRWTLREAIHPRASSITHERTAACLMFNSQKR